ncbi:MAG: protein translocase subunit SecF [Candidatus Buchananbacteria bacterium]|nr:protein translocase subunit SecF [Candidatus Buchananbacteria bacterium]
MASRNNFMIIKYRKIWFFLSGTAVLASILAFAIVGLKWGIDFTGGSLVEVEFSVTRPSNDAVNQVLTSVGIDNATIQPVEDTKMVMRFKEIDEATHQKLLTALEDKFKPELNLEGAAEAGIVVDTKNAVQETRFDSIGPSLGQELKEKTVWAIIIALIAIISYVAWAFRKVSKPIASWKYGLIAILALFHDIIITIGVFTLLGKFYGLEVNAPFVAALLTILGYSVNDTIVVFDRTRENLVRRIGENFAQIVQESLNEVIVRSINASFTVLIVLFAILLIGGSTLRDFTLALIIGVAVGSYSSIFLASPLLVVWEKWMSKK